MILRGTTGKKLSQRGDTIVEVMIALAVLGAVLGSAYVVANRNTMINRSSQERLEAVKVAESQLERLKAVSASNPIVFDQSGFCLSTTNMVESSGSDECTVDANGVPTTVDPKYEIAITRENYIAVGTEPEAGVRFNIAVTWVNARGDGSDSLRYRYEVYK